MNKKFVATALGAIFAISAMGSAFAAEADSTSKQDPSKYFAKKEFGARGTYGGDKLTELAAEKGITVDELKAQMEQERQAKLEERAAEQGMTVDELKAQREQKRGTQEVQ